MTARVFALDTQPGIQRDGTVFDKDIYNDGRWVRFQRGRPRKVFGYREIIGSLAGPSRGIYLDPLENFTNVYSGYANGLQVLPIDNNGMGAGLLNLTLSNFSPDAHNLWQFDALRDAGGTNAQVLIAHPGQNLSDINSPINTPVLYGDVTSLSMSQIGIFQDANANCNLSTIVTLSATDDLIGAGQEVTGTGIPVGTTVVSTGLANTILKTVTVVSTSGQFSCASTSGLFIGQTVQVTGSASSIGLTTGATYYIIATNYATTFTLSATAGGSAVTTIVAATTGVVFTLGTYQEVELSAAATISGTTTLTFNNGIEVSGGVVALHPYLFVYGNNGLIKNCSAGNLQNWVGADANETNVASTKIVKGLPVRGGSNSPSGIFWSLDSVIRVSYAPSQVGTSQIYWRYDIVTSQSSILSSQSVIEYDGIYYWIGVDRFLMYNGVVKEVPNPFNQNYFFDNLNYAQRQKVYASKVPRFGEIWWYYPRGNATECNDAIIYNIRENCWYDAGQAEGARRSAGYFSQVFHYPVNADPEPNAVGAISYANIVVPGTGYTNGSYDNVDLLSGLGSGATADIVVSGGAVTSVTLVNRGTDYIVGDLLTASLPGGSNFTVEVTYIHSLVSLYQHELGTNAIKNNTMLAIESYFETNDLGVVSGGPSQPAMVGENVWLRLERVEPDFILTGEMALYVIGRPYAQEEDMVSQAYIFDANTGKIDMKEQRRELRLKFVSNTQNGDYQMGRVLLNADGGDVRGY